MCGENTIIVTIAVILATFVVVITITAVVVTAIVVATGMVKCAFCCSLAPCPL
jgi:hypothetical protein